MPRLFLSRKSETHRPPGSTHVVCQSWGAAIAQFDPAHLHHRPSATGHADAAADACGGAPGVSISDAVAFWLRFTYVAPVLISKY